VKAEAGLKSDKATGVQQVVENPYKDRLDDLLELVNEPTVEGSGNNHHRGRLEQRRIRRERST